MSKHGFIDLKTHGNKFFVTFGDIPRGAKVTNNFAVVIPAPLIENKNVSQVELMILNHSHDLGNPRYLESRRKTARCEQ